ncbi:hypothetical protein PR202_ga03640 [Eleusine coracana subsp. coracana]|uniref:Disease resistance protein n=1 Tax=Eleusine coracana subsp. coracana TaxID=191504 RepID=A0AAV5BNZ6_ELECO|nr:hypothetical protein PR202_ga03640 [Eleusine coracana subsp. coracana]
MLNLDRVAETAAGGSISNIVKKLASLSLGQLSKLREVSSNIESLEDELQIIHAVLLDLSNQEHPDNRLKLWMDKVRELAYDIEDAIDMFVLASENEHVRRVEESRDPNFIERIMTTIRRCTDSIKSLPSDYQIATKIQGLKDRVVAAEDQHKRLKTVDNSDFSGYDAIAIRDVARYSNPSSLVGIDAPSEDIIRMLTEGSSSSVHQHMVVAIVGFGGLGKTTLAKHVFDKIAAHFNCTAFVSVSRKPDIKKLLGDILLDFGSGDRLKDLRQLDELQLAKKLRKYIIGKKYEPAASLVLYYI